MATLREKPVPEFVNEGRVETGPVSPYVGNQQPQPYANASDFNTFGEEAAGKIEAGLNAVGNAANSYQEKQDHMWALQQVTNTKLDWQKHMSELQQAGQPVDPNKVVDDFNDYTGKILDSAPTGRAKMIAQESFLSMTPSLQGQALTLNRVLGKKQANDQLVQIAQALGTSVSNDPGTLRSSMRTGAIALRDSDADDATKSAVANDVAGIPIKAVGDSFQKNPAATLAVANAGGYDDLVDNGHIPAPTMDTWKQQATEALQQGVQAFRYNQTQQAKSYVDGVEDQGIRFPFNMKAYGLAFGKQGPAEVAKLQDKVQFAQDFYSTTSPMHFQTTDEIRKNLDGLVPDPNSPDFARQEQLKNKISAFVYGGRGARGDDVVDYSGILKMRAEDSFGYAMKYNPSLSQQSQDVEAVANDPQKYTPAREKLLQDTGVYLSSIGVPLKDQHVMSQKEAQDTAEKLSGTTDPETASQILDKIKKDFGAYTPRAIQDMQQLPKQTDGGKGIDPSYNLLLSNIYDQGMTKKLLTAFQLPHEEVSKVLTGNPDGTGPVSKVVQTGFDNSPVMTSLKGAMTALGNDRSTNNYIQGLMAGGHKLIAQYITEGKTPQQAVALATQNLFDSKYSTGTVNSIQPFVASRTDEMGKDYDPGFLKQLPSLIEKEQQRANDIDTDGLKASKGLSEADIQKKGRMVMQPDFRGVNMVYDLPNGKTIYVPNKQGQPWERRFSDMWNTAANDAFGEERYRMNQVERMNEESRQKTEQQIVDDHQQRLMGLNYGR